MASSAPPAAAASPTAANQGRPPDLSATKASASVEQDVASMEDVQPSSAAAAAAVQSPPRARSSRSTTGAMPGHLKDFDVSALQTPTQSPSASQKRKKASSPTVEATARAAQIPSAKSARRTVAQSSPRPARGQPGPVRDASASASGASTAAHAAATPSFATRSHLPSPGRPRSFRSLKLSERPRASSPCCRASCRRKETAAASDARQRPAVSFGCQH